MQRSALCRSRRELSNEYLLAKFGFDAAENEPCKVCLLSAYRSPRYAEVKPVEREDVAIEDSAEVARFLSWQQIRASAVLVAA